MKGYIQTCLLALAAVALGQANLGDLPDCAVRNQTSSLFFWGGGAPPILNKYKDIYIYIKTQVLIRENLTSFIENLCIIRSSKGMQRGRYQMLLLQFKLDPNTVMLRQELLHRCRPIKSVITHSHPPFLPACLPSSLARARRESSLQKRKY